MTPAQAARTLSAVQAGQLLHPTSSAGVVVAVETDPKDTSTVGALAVLREYYRRMRSEVEA